jgi:hypothetical protein
MKLAAPWSLGALESFIQTSVATMFGQKPWPKTTGVWTWLNTFSTSYHSPGRGRYCHFDPSQSVSLVISY